MNNGSKDQQIIPDDNIGKINPRNIEQEMQESYLAYAMSVIVSRALPDARDGLKPVHRRVLYAMHEIGLTPNSKYRKSATVVGDVLGKYHPHGDIAVYDTLVRMAQSFSLRYPLIDGQGNFGSMDGDSAAAMRYTEARMSKITQEMLADIDKETVDMTDNYDGTRKEPVVLPAKIPQLLLNGTLGIAVGMATQIPPHNLSEVIDGTVALIGNSDLNTEDLIKYIKGPDFPTGGIVFGKDTILEAYGTGKGKIIIRGVAEIEESTKNNKSHIIISEIPYQINKADLIAKIAELVKNKKIEGITDLRDESDRKSGVRIVIELKNNAYPKKILNKLYTLTNLQTSYHFNMLALVDGIQPKTLTLKQIIEEFIKHRKEIVTRRTKYELNKAKDRAHILEGLKKALDHIDKIISLIKSSETKEIAHENLIKDFNLSDKQASAILEMKLSTLAGLERKKIDDELKEKLELIKKLTEILGSESKILNIIKKELLEIKEKYSDDRKTKIMSGGIKEFKMEDLVPNEQVVVTITKDNYIKKVPMSAYRSQKRGGKGKAGITTKEKDSVDQLLVTMTHNKILFFTDKGRVFCSMVYEIPTSGRKAKGQALVNFLELSSDEKVTSVLSYNNMSDKKYLFMTTTNGYVKKTSIDKFSNVRRSGLVAIKLNENDKLRWVSPTSGNNEIILITKNGQSIHFNESQVREMGRSARGVRGIRLRPSDYLISANVIVDQKASIFTISEKGFGKRTTICEFTLQNRGGIGLRAARITSKTGKIVASQIVDNLEDDIVIISQKGIILRTSVKSVKKLRRDTQGVRLIKIANDDAVASMSIFSKEKEKETSNQQNLNFPRNNKFKTKEEDKVQIKSQANTKDSTPNYWGKNQG